MESAGVSSWLWLVGGLIAGMVLRPLISGWLDTCKSSLKSMFWSPLDQLDHRKRLSSMVKDSALAHFLDSNISPPGDDENSSSYHYVDSKISQGSALSEDEDSSSYLSVEEDIAPVHSLDSNNSREEFVDSRKQVYRYDVFLSFRGVDVRNNFVDHLYQRLTRKGIFTFKDDKRLKRGKRVKPELMSAIRDSRLAIIVFSKTYPTSTWCLDEMSAIADRLRQKKQSVFPVFYDITASDVGKQKGPYKDHFSSEQFRKIPKKRLDRWKADMKYLSKVNGFPMVDHSNIPQTEHLEKIIRDVAEKLNHKFTLDYKDLIEIKPRLEELQRLLKLESSEDVAFQILEIWGMSGIGKTVLAKILFDRISYQFDACCFIQDVNHIHRTHRKGASTEIQKQILHQIFQEKDVKFLSPPEIAKMLQNRLCNPNLPKRTLIVLDDVSSPKQWDDLGIDHNLLGTGSRVVITTRFKHVLDVSKSYEIYEVPLLNDEEAALELFRRKASKIDCPNPIVRDVSRKVIEYAQCLPSAIVVLGSYFNQRTERLWEHYLERWRKYPDEEYMNELQETSYKDLSGDEKIIFLDIACFFEGKRNKDVEQVLESRIQYPSIAIQEIWRKSLIKVRNEDIHMHQILRDLGKKIVRGNNTEDPKCWSRLWDAKDFQKVLMSDMEANKVQAIVLDEDVSRFKIERLSQMRDLRLLILHHQSSSRNLTFSFNQLCYLLWHGYSYTSLSLSVWSNLVELNLPNSSIQQLWEDSQEMPNLKRVDLSNSKNLSKTPTFECCREVTRLDFTGCTNLIKVHESIGLLTKLDYLSLQDCTSITLLDFGTNCCLSSLRTLDLSGCTNLRHTPSFESCRELEILDISGCTNLTEVHDSIGVPTKLDYLRLQELCFSLGAPTSGTCQVFNVANSK